MKDNNLYKPLYVLFTKYLPPYLKDRCKRDNIGVLCICQMSDKSSLGDEDSAPKDPFLIIGPGSVLYNWMDELETWGYFTVG